jgi:exodeoxyribonuclease V alpha subunit
LPNQPRQPHSAPSRRAPDGAEASRSADELDLCAVVEGITYQHPESLYTVLRVTLEAEFEAPGELFGARAARERVVHAVGKAGAVPIGGRVALRGAWQSHPKHGPQFRFRSLQELPPVGPEGVARYLASKNFRGVGPVLAQRIVATLGAEALERIDADPDCLRRVHGLKRATRQALVDGLRAQRGERELHAFLYGLELNAGQVLEAA